MVEALVAKLKVAFPAEAVAEKLRSELLQTVHSNASLHGLPLPADITAQCAFSSQIDSLDVVGMLCSLDMIVGFELKENIVRSGGYRSVNDALSHVLPCVEAAWNKKGR